MNINLVSLWNGILSPKQSELDLSCDDFLFVVFFCVSLWSLAIGWPNALALMNTGGQWAGFFWTYTLNNLNTWVKRWILFSLLLLESVLQVDDRLNLIWPDLLQQELELGNSVLSWGHNLYQVFVKQNSVGRGVLATTLDQGATTVPNKVTVAFPLSCCQQQTTTAAQWAQL